MTNILMVGDIVGKGGRRAVVELIPTLRREFGCSFVIANGENMAGGGGLTSKCINALTQSKVDVVTAGDHVWDQREFATCADDYEHVLRPDNVDPRQPGNGFGVYVLHGDRKVGVINLLGRTFMKNPADCPFRAADRILETMSKQTSIIIVDFHAEATSEKIALGRYLDGRVSAVFGTHTHVATADEQLFPGGTAFQCDVGMVGARESILGRAIEPVVQRFSTGMPARFTVVEQGIRLNATVVTVDETTGRATKIQRVQRDWN